MTHDVRLALRGLRRIPGFTATAILTLALGIGANTAMFSVANAVLFRPLPFRDADRLVVIATADIRRGSNSERSPLPVVEAWRQQNHTLRDVAHYTTYRETLNEQGDRERLRVAAASPSLFAVLGVPPAIGRAFSSDDERSRERVAVISHGFWHRRFGADSAVVGRVFHVEASSADGRRSSAGNAPSTVEYRVIGVMAREFYFPDNQVDFWVPAISAAISDRQMAEPFGREARRWMVVARLEPSVTARDVERDLVDIGKRLTLSYPNLPADFPGFAVAVASLRESLTGERVQATLWLLLAAVTLVLGIACANVASLLLARGATRRRELAVRRALGATRARLAAQLLVESLVLSGLGGALGLVMALALGKVVGAVAAGALPRLEETALDVRVLAFAVVASLASGVVVGLAPILSDSTRAGDVLNARGDLSGSRRTVRFRSLLVTAQCALAVALLAGAGLLLRSFERLRAIDPGFDPRQVVTVRLEFPAAPSRGPRPDTSADIVQAAGALARAQQMEAAVNAIAALGGVDAVGLIDDMFVGGDVRNRSIGIPGRDSLSVSQLNDGRVTAGFFRVMRVPLLRGRYLESGDAPMRARSLNVTAPEPVVVNETFARRFFPNENPLGRVFSSGSQARNSFEIVGVVGDMHRQGRERSAVPEYFTAYVPVPQGRADLLVRTKPGVDPNGVARAVQGSIKELIPGALIWSVSTAARQLDDFESARTLETWLLSAFAALALVLSVVGLYGSVHYSVAQRTREIGLRMALGATSTAVMRKAIVDGMRAPLMGLALGVPIAAVSTRLMTHLLFGTTPGDPVTYLTISTILVASAIAACYLPARRASRVDPMTALRHE
jgi:putative ABC transport system permease protein